MSQISREKIETLKNILKELHKGSSIEELKRKFKDALEGISPSDIPLAEQELLEEGIPISEILRLCDLHIELLRDLLCPAELKSIPKGHPLELLSRENERIYKLAEALNIYAESLSKAEPNEAISYLRAIIDVVSELRRFRLHYRKIQMLIFPYLERRGITAVPRVLWGKEDQAVLKIRELAILIERGLSDPSSYAKSVAEKARELAKDLTDLIFREERILFPSISVLFSEGEWAAIHEEAKRIGYLIPIEVEWTPKAKPILPHEVSGVITPEQIEKLPDEFRFAAIATLAPDTYQARSEGDLEFETGFLSRDEVEAIFRHLPIELTYADTNDRVVFFSESIFRKGFARTKTLIGRRVEYCHPPRLESLIRNIVNELKGGKIDHREYWTRLGDRIIRVIVTAVRDKDGNYLGTLEMVEDLTEIVNNPEEVKKKIIIL
ncbi:MAG: DUF438 domain-containing protein [Candidatus Bathyarchaeia archaeon]|nr:DUF438 domain-containing protein [Candidatus Bathyarchaeota archaeon]